MRKATRNHKETPTNGNKDNAKCKDEKEPKKDGNKNGKEKDDEESSFVEPDSTEDSSVDDAGPRFEEPTWDAPSFLEPSFSPSIDPHQSIPSTPVPSVRETDPYAETYNANSATQSYLHDTYYPWLYHDDWHNTQYDETDRAQDYYNDIAYRDQSEHHQQDYYRYQDYYGDHSAVAQPFGVQRPSTSYSASLGGVPFYITPAVASASIFASPEAVYSFLSESGADSVTQNAYQKQEGFTEWPFEATASPFSQFESTEAYQSSNAADSPFEQYDTNISNVVAFTDSLASNEESVLTNESSSERLDINRFDDRVATQPSVNNLLQQSDVQFDNQTNRLAVNQEPLAPAVLEYQPSSFSDQNVSEGSLLVQNDVPVISEVTSTVQPSVGAIPIFDEQSQAQTYIQDVAKATIYDTPQTQHELRNFDVTTANVLDARIDTNIATDNSGTQFAKNAHERLMVNRFDSEAATQPLIYEPLQQSSTLVDDHASRLTVNRMEEIAPSVISSEAIVQPLIYESLQQNNDLLYDQEDRLTVNRVEDPNMHPLVNEALEQRGDLLSNDTNRLTVNRFEQQANPSQALINEQLSQSIDLVDDQASRLIVNRLDDAEYQNLQTRTGVPVESSQISFLSPELPVHEALGQRSDLLSNETNRLIVNRVEQQSAPSQALTNEQFSQSTELVDNQASRLIVNRLDDPEYQNLQTREQPFADVSQSPAQSSQLYTYESPQRNDILLDDQTSRLTVNRFDETVPSAIGVETIEQPLIYESLQQRNDLLYDQEDRLTINRFEELYLQPVAYAGLQDVIQSENQASGLIVNRVEQQATPSQALINEQLSQSTDLVDDQASRLIINPLDQPFSPSQTIICEQLPQNVGLVDNQATRLTVNRVDNPEYQILQKRVQQSTDALPLLDEQSPIAAYTQDVAKENVYDSTSAQSVLRNPDGVLVKDFESSADASVMSNNSNVVINENSYEQFGINHTIIGSATQPLVYEQLQQNDILSEEQNDRLTINRLENESIPQPLIDDLPQQHSELIDDQTSRLIINPAEPSTNLLTHVLPTQIDTPAILESQPSAQLSADSLPLIENQQSETTPNQDEINASILTFSVSNTSNSYTNFGENTIIDQPLSITGENPVSRLLANEQQIDAVIDNAQTISNASSYIISNVAAAYPEMLPVIQFPNDTLPVIEEKNSVSIHAPSVVDVGDLENAQIQDGVLLDGQPGIRFEAEPDDAILHTREHALISEEQIASPILHTEASQQIVDGQPINEILHTREPAQIIDDKVANQILHTRDNLLITDEQIPNVTTDSSAQSECIIKNFSNALSAADLNDGIITQDNLFFTSEDSSEIQFNNSADELPPLVQPTDPDLQVALLTDSDATDALLESDRVLKETVTPLDNDLIGAMFQSRRLHNTQINNQEHLPALINEEVQNAPCITKNDLSLVDEKDFLLLKTAEQEVSIVDAPLPSGIKKKKSVEDVIIDVPASDVVEIEDGVVSSGKPPSSFAKKAGLGVLGFATLTTARAAKATAGHALGGASALLSVAAKEDEDVKKVDDARTLVTGAVARERASASKRKARDHRKLVAREAVIGATAYLLDEKEASQALKPDVLLESVGVREYTPSVRDKLEEVGVRDFSTVSDEAELLTSERNITKLIESEDAPIDAKALAQAQKNKAEKAKLLEENDVEEVLIKEKSIKEKKAGDKSESKIEAALKKKKNALKEDGLTDGDLLLKADAVALAAVMPAKALKRGVEFGTGAAKNIVESSALKLISKDNEDVTLLLDSVDKVKSVARIPRKAFNTVRGLVGLVRNFIRSIYHTVTAIVSMGWPAILAAGFLIMMIIVAIVSNLVIINENQEVSETSALIAELDDMLEKKIHSYGHDNDEDGKTIPIYYADARGTYYGEDADGKPLLMDLDMRNETCKLVTVDASTVDVFTNPDEIIAYIDAKYTGEWQVGSATWKITIEVKGHTINIIDWQHVPAWVQKLINSADREWFELQAGDDISAFLQEEYPDLTETENYLISTAAAEELGNVIFDQQMQGINDEVIYEAIRAGVGEYRDKVSLTDDQLKQLNGRISDVVTELVGEQDPRALVYDEIVALHSYLNWWSEDYEHIDASAAVGAGSGIGATGSNSEAGTNNSSGYPNASGYDPEELAKWEGYNEVSVYGISEAGTTSITGDGTTITNDWSDQNMAIACEGLQMGLYAYWTGVYKDLHGTTGPVRVTMYNPETGKTVTAEVRDVGGWRGYNERYAGKNPTRQWDLLPAVWLALGGTQSSGLMHVYWKVDNTAPVTGAGGGIAAPVAAKVEVDYLWPAETDKGDGVIAINRATYIRHNIQDLVRCEQLIQKCIGSENYASNSEYKAVLDFVTTKLRDIMQPLLTHKNTAGDSYTDYFMTRRELANPFGTYNGGKIVEWVVIDRFAPGFQDSFDKDKVSVGVKPLNGGWAVYTVKEGTVEKIEDGTIVITNKTADGEWEVFEYGNVGNIQVKVGDELERSAHLGYVSDTEKPLLISWYERTLSTDMTTLLDEPGMKHRSWAYNPALFMEGFAGYEEPDAPTQIAAGGGARSLEDCTTIVDFAYSRLGCPYVWGATGPDTFDCSGLTQWCYAKAGINIPRNSEAQHDAAVATGNCFPIDESRMQPGDIVWKKGHVGIYIGNNQYIHAPQTGDVVKISTGISYFTHVLRFS